MLFETEFFIMKIFENKESIEEYLKTERSDIFISDIYIGRKPEGVEIIIKSTLQKYL